MCKKNVKILYKCTECQSGNYCLKACQIKQYLEHKKYCAVISELDHREKLKLEQFIITDSEILHKRYCSQLVRLIGEKPITEGYINNKMYKGLWDTSSVVSVINKHWLKSNFSNEKIFLSEEFLGTPLHLKTANNTKLNIEKVKKKSKRPKKLKYPLSLQMNI